MISLHWSCRYFCRAASECSAMSWGIEVLFLLIRAETVRKKSLEMYVTHRRPETKPPWDWIFKQKLIPNENIRKSVNSRTASSYYEVIYIHRSTHHFNESCKQFLLYIANNIFVPDEDPEAPIKDTKKHQKLDIANTSVIYITLLAPPPFWNLVKPLKVSLHFYLFNSSYLA